MTVPIRDQMVRRLTRLAALLDILRPMEAPSHELLSMIDVEMARLIDLVKVIDEAAPVDLPQPRQSQEDVACTKH